jgi:hypothetical protein
MSRAAPFLLFPFAFTLACKSEAPKPDVKPTAEVAEKVEKTEELEPPTRLDSAPSTATITFSNSCTETIWLTEFGNAASAACKSNDDCNGGTCLNGSCEQIPCTSNVNCTSIQFCDAASCTSDGQCPAGSTCSSNSDCTIPGQTCDTTIGQCSPTCNSGTSQCMCAQDSDCPAEGQCIDNLCTGGICRYSLTPSPGYWQLDAGAKQTIQIPIGWGGRFWARTGCPDDLATCKPGFASCTQNSDCCNESCAGPPGQLFCTPGVPACATGDCQAGAACDVSAGAPISLFEVFFTDATTTWFDASLVDGINVPLAATAVDANGNPLTDCTPANVAGCSQTLDASTLGPLRVASTTACSSNADCPFLAECLDGTCTAGYSAACDACRSSSPATALACADNQDLYCCTGPNADSCNGGHPTCMNDSDCPAGGTCNSRQVCTPLTPNCSQDSDCAANYVCDSELKVCLPNAGLTQTCCGPYNPAWLAAMQTWAAPYKNACPNAYAYQFDDPSSNTVCTGQAANFNVTFCQSD